MRQIRQYIQSALKAICPTVYFQNAPETATFPYLTYDIPTGYADGEQMIWTLDVDAWDTDKDTTALETLAAAVAVGLHRRHFVGENITFQTYRTGRLALDDTDTRIQRRKVMFELRCLDGAQVKRGG